MTAGLPGTGIGGLYYLLLTALMPFREVWLTVRGRSSAARWREVLRHVALAGGIIGALLATAWLIRAALLFGASIGLIDLATLRSALDAGGVWSRFAAFVASGILAGILLAAAVLGVVAGPGARRPPTLPPRDVRSRWRGRRGGTGPAAPVGDAT